ncbi:MULTISPECIES: hypothetical protein [unclassified Bradyrhizobium]|nr:MULTISPECIES: hypothetical protein [unclassified Bradyrhizobium]
MNIIPDPLLRLDGRACRLRGSGSDVDAARAIGLDGAGREALS